MKYIHLFALLLPSVFHTTCGQKPTNAPKGNIRSEAKDKVTSPGTNENYHTTYKYTDSIGKHLIILNGFPKGQKYTDPDGKEYFRVIFWTRIINETDNPLELTIGFSGDPYENRYVKILPSDTLTRDKEDLFDYGVTDFDTFLDNSIHKPTSLKRRINPNESGGFYVVILSKPGGATGILRSGLSLREQDLFL